MNEPANKSLQRVLITIIGHRKSDAERFVQTISENGINHFGIGQLKIDDHFMLHLRVSDSIPDLRHADADKHLGFVIVFNGTNAAHLWEIRSLVESFRAQTKAPLVLAAHYTELKQAYPAETIRAALHLTHELPLVICKITDLESVKRVMLALLYQVIEAMRLAEHQPEE